MRFAVAFLFVGLASGFVAWVIRDSIRDRRWWREQRDLEDE